MGNATRNFARPDSREVSRMPTRERGRPTRTTLARPHPSFPPGSTGNGARTLLWTSPCRSLRQGGRLRHRRETERHATAEHAGGTPALPGGLPPVTLGGPSSSFVDNSPPSTLQTSNFPLQTSLSRAPAPNDGRGRGYAILPGGGEKGLVTLLVFKTCASRRCRDGWVRFPHASANPL